MTSIVDTYNDNGENNSSANVIVIIRITVCNNDDNKIVSSYNSNYNILILG